MVGGVMYYEICVRSIQVIRKHTVEGHILCLTIYRTVVGNNLIFGACFDRGRYFLRLNVKNVVV